MDKIYPETMLRKQRRRQVSGQLHKMRKKERSHCILSSLPGRSSSVEKQIEARKVKSLESESGMLKIN